MANFLYPLIWKNLHIRRRHWVVSFLDLTVPIFLTCLIAYLHFTTGGSNPDGSDKHLTEFVSVPQSKREIIESFSQCIDYNDFFFAPDTPVVKDIMTLVNASLRELNIFFNMKQFKTESDIEHAFIMKYENKSTMLSCGFGGIFKNTGDDNTFDYTLRSINGDWNTKLKFPMQQWPGPMRAEEMYMNQGFLVMQIIINDAILELKNATLFNFSMAPNPYPPYETDSNFEIFFSTIIPLFISFSYIPVVISMVPRIVEEKLTGSREWMRLIGLSSTNLWLSWIIFEMMFYVVTITVVTALLLCKIGNYTVLSTPNFLIIWILLFLFCTNSTVYVATISTIFSNPSLASVISSFMWIAPSFIISKFDYSDFPFVGKLITCIFPSMSLDWAFRTISGYEASQASFSFGDLFYLHSGESLDMTVGVVMLCQITMIVFYFLLLLYLDAVFPGKYGRARPWYFIGQAIFRIFRPKTASQTNFIKSTDVNNLLFENLSGLTAGLQIRNLKKTFGNFAAVDDISFDIYKGQITALLGHNGAGKTTLINILTGMYTATSGDIYKDGENVFDNFKDFQSKLGLCPQHDLLFPYLTAKEHVIFFGLMRGLSYKSVKAECEELFHNFGISAKADELPVTLSGGMKRKVCLSVALVGNPELVVLDEPTSGMDPESRRETWNKLLNLRGHRIILLTTHFMEEADVLGDVIAIMDHGKVKCYGTSLFLKKHLGEGYSLQVQVSDNHSQVCNVIEESVPKAVRKVFTEEKVVYSLPSDCVSLFPNLFKKIENLPQVNGINVSCTTMEDVFLKVDQLSSGHDEVDNVMSVPLLDPDSDDVHGSDDALTPKPIEGYRLFYTRFYALSMKKYLYIYRQWPTYTFTVLIWPFLLAAFASYISSLFYHMTDSMPSLTLTLDFYGDTNVIIPPLNSSFVTAYKTIVKNEHSYSKAYSINSNTSQTLLDMADQNLLNYRSSYIVSLDMNNSVPYAYYSTVAYHSPPISLNILYNAWLAAKNVVLHIVTSNHPLQISNNNCSQMKIVAQGLAISFFWLFMVPITLMSMFCSFCKLHHDERIKSGKLLQFMTGTPPILYWITAFLCDFSLLLLSSGFIMLAIYLLDYANVFSAAYYGYFFALIALSGMSGIFFSYFMSFFFNTYASVYSAQVFLAMLFGQVIYLILFIIKQIVKDDVGLNIIHFLHYVLLLYPGYSSCSAMQKMILHFSLKFIYKSCDFNMELPGNENMFSFNIDYGVYTEAVYLGCGFFYFFAIILLTDHGITSQLFNCIHKSIVGPVENYDRSSEDHYVRLEKNFVNDLRNSGYKDNRYSLIVDGLGKKYNRKSTAVKDVTFVVSKGQCFGLLGVNGAGKSTTFKILSGDIIASKGDALLLGSQLSQNKLEYQSHIGYCPQFDAIIECLTGWEMLKLYASLRGVNPAILDQTMSTWISEFGLLKYCNKQCGNYSGGNKRKLSTAIALIGDPQVIFLDEPTTGVDPVARRKFWEILAQLQKKGQTVIITSHSMDECEKVCDRLTIMAQGVMKCIGTINDLKSRYGQGFSIMIKLKTQISDDVLTIKRSIQDMFSSNCVLQDEHIGLLHYHLRRNDYHWSTLFSLMEKLKHTCPGIDDYVITETSLEQVFLFFAKAYGNSEEG